MLSQVSSRPIVNSNITSDSSPVELVEQCLSRIDQWESKIRAWAYIDSAGARAAAAQLERDVAQGKPRGPLHGMPIGVKDIVAVQGMPTRAASPLTSPDPAPRDAPAIKRLREAGAIILEKTITTEWACFDPPPTQNPWNFSRTPGGSSSGSAAAVAANMCVATVGSQTGGSVIRPGSYCGVYSSKPTYAAISLEGVLPLSPPLDHLGAFARSIGDLTPVVLAMMGASPTEASQTTPFSGAPRIGVIEDYFLDVADAEVVSATRAASSKLKAAGCQLNLSKLPSSFADVHAAHRVIMVHQAARYHQKQFAAHPDQYGPCISSVLVEGLAVSDKAYRDALAHQRAFQKELAQTFSDFDALLVPAAPAAAPPSATTGDLRFNSPWTHSGFPVIGLPIALDSQGLPLAIQLIGRPQQDRELFALARWCEAILPFKIEPPL